MNDEADVPAPAWHTLPIQWYRNGVPIPGETGARYVTTDEDVGTVISWGPSIRQETVTIEYQGDEEPE